MDVALMALLSVLPFVAGEPRAVCPNKTIEAEEGRDVFLPCHLEPQADLSDSTVDWKRDDFNKVVHAYRNGKDHLRDQMDQYRGRTTLSREGLIGGNLTLLLSSVQPTDAGRYRCNVPRLTRCVINLIVVNESSTTPPPVTEVVDNDEDAAEEQPLWKTVVPGVLVVLVALGVAAAAVILVKSGRIQIWMRREPETTTDGSEMENSRKEDANRAKGSRPVEPKTQQTHI